jgi:hypothetical protein
METIANMTKDELKQFINDVLDERDFEPYSDRQHSRSASTRSVKEINESIRRKRWTPPPGTPSTLEMLREDRERLCRHTSWMPVLLSST